MAPNTIRGLTLAMVWSGNRGRCVSIESQESPMLAVLTTQSDPPKIKKYIGVEGALALCGIAVLLVAVVLATGRGSFAEKTDFSCVYTGARIVYQGDGPKLYSPEEQGRLRIS